MGIMTKWMQSSLANGGALDTNANTEAIFKALGDQIDPTTAIQWQTQSPTVIKRAQGSTLAKADKAERDAALYEQACINGKRALAADLKRQRAHVELVASHRQYMGDVASAHLDAVAANKGLASRLQGMRKTYAELGMGLERKTETVAQAIDITAAKYGRIKA
jgi:hypothetical protein